MNYWAAEIFKSLFISAWLMDNLNWSMNKKGSLALAIVAIILALIILAVYLVNVSQRECNSNRDCPGNAYCGNDYDCHAFPEQIVVKENNLVPAAIIIGTALIIASYIFRKGKKC